MLVYQNRISIWISNHEAGRADSAFVRFGKYDYATIFELTLQRSNRMLYHEPTIFNESEPRDEYAAEEAIEKYVFAHG